MPIPEERRIRVIRTIIVEGPESRVRTQLERSWLTAGQTQKLVGDLKVYELSSTAYAIDANGNAISSAEIPANPDPEAKSE